MGGHRIAERLNRWAKWPHGRLKMKRPASQVDHPMQRQRWRFRQIGTQPRATHYWLSQEVPLSELVHTAAESAERKPPPWCKWIVLVSAPTMSDPRRPPFANWGPHE